MALQPAWEWSVKVPFTKRFPTVLKEEMMLVVCGMVPEDSKHFVINFQQGEEPVSIPFHFAPCFDGGKDKVVYSCQVDKNWAPMQDKCCDLNMRGKKFNLTFFFWKNCYQACLNGTHLLIYDHSESDWKIDTVNIYGTVKVDSVKAYDLHCAKSGS
ncbi:galectin-8-like [Carcharodon carcharias]|uniref:galectin-8-like n=1 Tax=Carcharodon carcharias TaxID=13397 RepID=UPI001B7F77D5|nr:galectin-8-like [Carcharodon carcharias]